MEKFFPSILILLSGIAVGMADALVKRAAQGGSMPAAWKSPWMIAALILYIVQILFFIYIFQHGWKLGIVSTIQIVFFSFTTVGIGYVFFHETLTAKQTIGAALAVIGVILMNV